jgi:hypothetical protein
MSSTHSDSDSKKVYQTIQPPPIQSLEFLLNKVDDWIKKSTERFDATRQEARAKRELSDIEFAAVWKRISNFLARDHNAGEELTAKVKLWKFTVSNLTTKRKDAEQAVEVVNKEVADAATSARDITLSWYQSVEMTLAQAVATTDTSTTTDNSNILGVCVQVREQLLPLLEDLCFLPGSHTDGYNGGVLGGASPLLAQRWTLFPININVGRIEPQLQRVLQTLKKIAKFPPFTVSKSGTQTA